MNPRMGVELAARSSAVSCAQQRQSEPWRVTGFDAILSPGYQGVLGLEGISGPDALRNPWYSELCTAAGMESVGGWRLLVHPGSMKELKPLYDLLNLRY